MRKPRFALHGAWAKVGQAYEHLNRFEKMFPEFAKSMSFARIVRPGQELPEAAEDGFGADDVWDELACTAGDCIHNLRCALDHAAYAVAHSRGLPESMLRKVYFTVRDTKAEFDRMVYAKESVEQRIGADWIAFLESMQPFADPHYVDLGRITRLDNVDKHRVVLSLTPRSDVFVQRPGEEPRTWTAELENGRVRLQADEPGMMLASSYLVMDDVPLDVKGHPVERDLLDFYSVVQDVLRAAAARFF